MLAPFLLFEQAFLILFAANLSVYEMLNEINDKLSINL